MELQQYLVIILSTLQASFYLFAFTVPSGNSFYFSHFTEEETEAQWVEGNGYGHSPDQEQTCMCLLYAHLRGCTQSALPGFDASLPGAGLTATKL